MPEEFHLPAEREKAEYDKHQNSADDAGYCKFLSRLCGPLLDRLEPRAEGLDFGCGPGPALSVLLKAQGHSVEVHDKFYAHHPEVLQRQYDFITATEVFEHLSEPARSLNLLWSLLKPGGMFGVMTKLVIDKDSFERWHYKNDPTHIVFFSEKTMHWLAQNWHAEFEPVANDAFIFRKA